MKKVTILVPDDGQKQIQKAADTYPEIFSMCLLILDAVCQEGGQESALEVAGMLALWASNQVEGL